MDSAIGVRQMHPAWSDAPQAHLAKSAIRAIDAEFETEHALDVYPSGRASQPQFAQRDRFIQALQLQIVADLATNQIHAVVGLHRPRPHPDHEPAAAQ